MKRPPMGRTRPSPPSSTSARPAGARGRHRLQNYRGESHGGRQGGRAVPTRRGALSARPVRQARASLSPPDARPAGSGGTRRLDNSRAGSGSLAAHRRSPDLTIDVMRDGSNGSPDSVRPAPEDGRSTSPRVLRCLRSSEARHFVGCRKPHRTGGPRSPASAAEIPRMPLDVPGGSAYTARSGGWVAQLVRAHDS